MQYMYTVCASPNQQGSRKLDEIIYVNCAGKGKGNGDGTSWGRAFKRLQDALAVVQKGAQIWVAKGTYRPTTGDNRYASFLLKENVALYGGFDGTETERSQRNWEINQTVLSGDIGDRGNPQTNVFHVVLGADKAVIDGFTISGGNALDGVPNAPWVSSGESAENDDNEEPIIHLTPDMVIGHKSEATGAGMLIHQCAPLVRNCVFKDNVAAKGGGMYIMVATKDKDGGIERNEAPVIENCSFINNYSLKRGGGVGNDMQTHPDFMNCRFIGNTCAEKGGGMYNDFGCSPTVVSCLFADNAAVMAGAMGNDGDSNPQIINCTVTRNRAEEIGAGIYQGSGPSNDPIISNSIIWGNICENDEANIANWHQCNPTVTFSCIEGGYPGLGNIDTDPKFVDPDAMDFRLASLSPCIDSARGDVAPPRDIEGNPRYDDANMPDGLMAVNVMTGQFNPKDPVVVPAVDMGAYERQQDSVAPSHDIIFVTPAGSAEGTGASWDSAYCSLQTAMDHAYAAKADVWVSAGIYKPTNTANREASFILRDGVNVLGGFAGNETYLEQRDPGANETILSGDLGSTNSYHVLTGATGAVLDGFTISGGCANGPAWHRMGGGMINYPVGRDTDPFCPPVGYSPKLVNCVFKNNYAANGGAAYNFDRGTVEFVNCRFEDNSACSGGAVMDNVGSFTRYENCAFVNNSAQWKGGSLFVDYGSRPVIHNCHFEGNRAGVHGGAIYTISRASQLENTRAIIQNTTFNGNRCSKMGGAVYNFDASIINLDHCHFSSNHAGITGGAIATVFMAKTTMKACQFSDNTADGGEANLYRDETGTVDRV